MKNLIIAFSLIILICCSCMILVDDTDSEVKPKYQTNVTQGHILWSGINWRVYTQMQNSTWVDDHGRLHMVLQKVGDRWYGTQLDSPTTYLYGKFIWNISSTSLNLERNTSIGLFTYTDDSHEIDIEINQWPGYDPRLWFTNQPGSLDNNGDNTHYSVYSDSPYLNATNLTYTFDWEPTYITYSVLNSDGSIISSWNYTNAGAVPQIPATAIGRFGTVMQYSPVSEEPKEIVFNSFRYINSSSITNLDVNFSASPLSGTAPLSVTFTDKCTGSPLSRSWNFGDGSTSNEQNPMHNYTTEGTYTASLTVSDANGTNTKNTTITVLKPVLPVANFSTNVTGGYAPLSVQFSDNSENAAGWNWDFGDGFNSTAKNPMHTYSAAGYYTVNLTVSNANGTASKTSNMNARSISSTGPYAYIPNSGNGTVSVIDTATNTNLAVVNVGRNPWGVAVSSDGKKVYVTNVYSNSVSVIDTASDTVTATVSGFVEPWGVAVIPDGKKVYVAHSGSDKVSVIDTATNTVAATVTVGSYPRGVAASLDGTKVYVTNQNSNTVSVIDTATNNILATVNVGSQPWGITVSPDGTKVYVANYGSSTVSVIEATTNYVSATVSVGRNPVGISLKPDGTKAYVTNFGSNTVSVIDIVTNIVTTTVSVGNAPYGVSFTPDGNKAYVVNLESNNVSVINTATNSITATVSVGRSAAFGQFIVPPLAQPAKLLPVANFSTNVTSGYVPLSVLFTDKSKNANTWNWDFGDGFNSTQQNPTHTYSLAGNYTVNLILGNANGTNSKSATITLLAQPALPAANFSTNVTSGYAPLSVQFTDLSKNAASRSWDFGDGVISTQLNPVHTYSSAGSYTVNLIVSNANGTNSKSATISVLQRPVLPVANFNTNTVSGYAPLSVQFSDLSQNAASRSWDFNIDGNTDSSAVSPAYTYAAPGTYTVSLTVSNANGTNSKTTTITVLKLALPVASFSSNVISGNAPLNVLFSDTSTGTPTSWNWNFGDGTANSTQKNPAHTFSRAGSYTVTLTVGSASGSNTVRRTSYITAATLRPPVAALSANVTSGTMPLTVSFSDRSTGGSPVSWTWSFGDGTSSVEQNPVHTYNRAGRYTVRLTVRNAAGSNTITRTNYITANALRIPVAAHSANVTSGAAPLTVLFSDRSTGGSATSWVWSFGDGTSSTEKNPVHAYNKAGRYTVRLTVRNAAGVNTVTRSNYITVNALRPPVAAFSASPVPANAPFRVTFTDRSTGSPTSWSWDFGDNSAPSTVQNPVHTYSKAGRYTVRLTVSNAAGHNSVRRNNLINIQKRSK